MSKVIRNVKNIASGHSLVEVKVRNATSNKTGDPSPDEMAEIADLTRLGSTDFYLIMDVLNKRLGDKGKNWRQVLKSLRVLHYILLFGSERCVAWAQRNIYIIKVLQEFQYADEDGGDVGQYVRILAEYLVELILDNKRLRAERSNFSAKSYESRNLEERVVFAARDYAQAQRAGEDDAEYAEAIEASKHQEKDDGRKLQRQLEDDDLARAIKLSKYENQRRGRELEENNAASLFDDNPVQTMQPTNSFSRGHQQEQNKNLVETLNITQLEYFHVDPTDNTQSLLQTHAESLKSQGNTAMSQNDYLKAINLYTKALSVIPGDPICLNNRAAAYSDLKDYTSAVADVEAALAVDPKYAEAWSILGHARLALGDAKGSIDAYITGIHYEGNGGSNAMRRGLAIAKKRAAELKAESDDPQPPKYEAAQIGAGARGGLPGEGTGNHFEAGDTDGPQPPKYEAAQVGAGARGGPTGEGTGNHFETGDAGATAEESNRLDSITNNPQFQQLQHLVQQQPQLLEPILEQIGAGNLQLGMLVGQYPEESPQFLSDDGDTAMPLQLGDQGMLGSGANEVGSQFLNDRNAAISSPSTISLPIRASGPTVEMTHPTADASKPNEEIKLSDYFNITETHRVFTDIDCQTISNILQKSGKVSWSVAPRIYIILRKLGQLQLLDAFLDQGISDLWLPFTTASLPQCLSLAYHSEFLKLQPLVLTKALDLENGNRRHAHFTRDDPFPFESKGTLGQGGFGFVDKISSPLSGREFARKRFRRARDLRKAELQSFMNELKILKRLHHNHCVELVASYTDPKYFGIIMAPVAEYDLATFYDIVTSENVALLRSFFGCLANALNFLHEAKIRHRDIKPQNILVNAPNVYLTDFGISLDWENMSRSTTTQDTAKSMLYCAPEVARYEKRNTSADIWSLGCVFLEMFTIIKGKTVEEQRSFFRSRSDNVRFFENISSCKQWMIQTREIEPCSPSDVLMSEIVLEMLQENADDRILASVLANRISRHSEPGSMDSNPLCGDCCAGDTSSISDSGSDRDPLEDFD